MFLKNKNVKLNIVLIILFSILILLVVLSSYIFGILNDNIVSFQDQVEIQSREDARELLGLLRSNLEKAINTGTISIDNNEQFESWIKDIINNLTNTDKYKNITLLKITTDENASYTGELIWRSSLPPNSIIHINNTKINITDFMINQSKAKEYFEKHKLSIPENKDISYLDISDNQRIVNDFINQDILYFKNPDMVQKSLEKIYKGQPSTSHDNVKWIDLDNAVGLVEWTCVPKGFNKGLNNEDKTINGFPNLNYSKITIIAVIDQEYILKPYERIFDKYFFISDIVRCIIITAPIFAIIFMFYIIYNTKFKQCNKCYNNSNKQVLVKNNK